MHHPFSDAYELIERAEKRARDAAELIARSANDPGTVISDLDVHPPYAYLVLKFRDPIPDELPHLIREAMNDLRSALDYVGAACVRAAGRSDQSGTGFPFAATEAEFQRLGTRPGRGGKTRIPPEIFDIMKAHKGYGDNDGNKLLHALNDLRNVNIHRLLRRVGRTASNSNTQIRHRGGMELIENEEQIRAAKDIMWNVQWCHIPAWDAYRNHLIFCAYDPRVHEPMDLEATVQITFGDAGALTLQPPIPVLYQMVRMVNVIVAQVRVKAVELGLISF
jgi:hypothetical protein